MKGSSPLDLVKKNELLRQKARPKQKPTITFLLLIFDCSPWSVAWAVDSTSECLHVGFHQCGTGSKDAASLLKMSLITAPVTHKWRLYCTFSSPRLSSRRAVRSPRIISRPSRPSAGAHRSSLISLPPSAVLLLSL